MRIRKVKFMVPVLMGLFLAGCVSPVDRGVQAFNQGNYDLAASHWTGPAHAGDYAAQHNLGVLWSNGFGSFTQNNEQAAAWFVEAAKQGNVLSMVYLADVQQKLGYDAAALTWLNLAARWGNAEAISELEKAGQPVPTADLLAQKQHQERIKKKEADEAAALAAYAALYLLGCSTGVCPGEPMLPNSSTSTPQQTYTNHSAEESVASGSTRSNGCSSDFACGTGNICIKAPLESYGTCARAVDRDGIQNFPSARPTSLGPRITSNEACWVNTDCPIGFNCANRNCVKY